VPESEHDPAATAAALWEEIFVIQEEWRRMRESFTEHRAAVQRRHEEILGLLNTIAAQVEINTRAREDNELLVMQLLSVMRQWWQAQSDAQRILMQIWMELHPEAAERALLTPLAVPPAERAVNGDGG
jgi:hypothetical protein